MESQRKKGILERNLILIKDGHLNFRHGHRLSRRNNVRNHNLLGAAHRRHGRAARCGAVDRLFGCRCRNT